MPKSGNANQRALKQGLARLDAETKSMKRAAKQMKKTAPAVVAARNAARSSETHGEFANPYLKALVDPESWGAGIRYPDNFSRKTAMMKSVNTLELPRTSALRGLTPAGSFSAVVRPSMEKPIWTLQEAPLTGNHPVTVVVNAQGDFSGLFPADPAFEHDNADGLELENGVWNNIVGPLQWTALNNESWQNSAISSAAGVGRFFGIPGLDPAVAGNVVVNLLFLFPMTGFTISARGVTSTSAGTPLAVAGGASLNYALSLAAAAIPTDYGLPGTGIQIMVSGGTPQSRYPVATVAIQGSVRQTALRYQPSPLQDEATLENVVDRMRLVSQSMWVAYRGNTLQDGGQIAATLYGGGQPPGWIGFNDYPSVAGVPGSYVGALKLGNYTFWKPFDERDMVMRNYDEAGEDWTHPFMICFGQVSDLTQAIQLQLRVIGNYEFVSRSQLFSYEYATPSRIQIDHAAFSLREINSSMENPLHLKSIGKFLAKVGRGALSVAKYAAETAPVWLPMAATALAAL